MAKQPAIGQTKTRLCPPLTREQAAALYEALLRDTIALVASLEGADLAIAVTPPSAMGYFESISPSGTVLHPVTCKDIGECLEKTLSHLLNLGYSKALALNADGPSLPPDFLDQAINALNRSDLVFGPAQDGGYYLVGMKKMNPALFRGITWSTDQVLSQSLVKAKKLDLSTALLPQWYDIDTADDLHQLRNDLYSLSQKRLKHTRRVLTEFDERSSISWNASTYLSFIALVVSRSWQALPLPSVLYR